MNKRISFIRPCGASEARGLFFCCFPESLKRALELRFVQLYGLHVRGQQAGVLGQKVTFVDEQHRAAVGLGADDAAGGLQAFAKAGVKLGRFKAALAFVVCEKLHQGISLLTDLGHADAHDRSADQPVARQVDAL